MNANDHDNRLEEVAAYAIGGLDRDQVPDLENHLAGCKRCQEELRWLSPAVQALPEAVERQAPPPQLKQRLMAEVRSDLAADERRTRTEERRERAESRPGIGEWLRGLNIGGLTWKPLTGLALAILVIAGGIGYAVGNGSDSGGAHTTEVPVAANGIGAKVVTEDDRGELGVDVQLLKDALDVVSDGDRRDEEPLADGRRGQPLREATEDLLLAHRQLDRRGILRAHRPERRTRVGLHRETALEGGGLLLPVPEDVDDGREGGMKGRDREQGHLDRLTLAPGRLHRELESVDGILRQVARLVGDGTVAVAVDVAVLVAPRDDVVAALAEHGAGGPAQQLLALLVPQNDPVGGVDREDGLSAAGDPVEGLR